MARVTATALWFIYILFLYFDRASADKNNTTVLYFTDTASIPHVAGKSDSIIDELPYMVTMRMKPHWWSTALHCDGVVIGDRWVLTSARCCVKSCGTMYSAGQVCLRTGSATIDPEGVEYKIDYLTLKESYTLNSMENNLCLLKMQQSFRFGPNLKALVLAESEDYEDGIFAKVSGWSRKDGSKSNHLKTVTLPLISNTTCQEIYSAAGKSAGYITHSVFCALSPSQDYCHGEGGSPLVVNGKLAGIVTAGNGCGNSPGVYTKISEYWDWITQYIGDETNIDVRSRFD